MAKQTPKGPEGVFGSLTRARILGYLAQASQPQTGYAIAKDLEIGVSNAYPELERLRAWGIIASRPDPNGNTAYCLEDDDLRRFLLRRVRILSARNWFTPAQISFRENQAEEARRVRVEIPRSRLKREARPFRDEFQRPPEKDRLMRRKQSAPGGAP